MVVRLLPTCASIPYSHTRRSKHTEYMYIASYLHVYVDPYSIWNVFPLFFSRHARYLMMGRSLAWSDPRQTSATKVSIFCHLEVGQLEMVNTHIRRVGQMYVLKLKMSLLYSSSPFMHTHTHTYTHMPTHAHTHTHTQTWSSNTVISLSFVCWSKKRYHSSGTC